MDAYFQLAQTPRVWRELDQWLRHRLRAILLKQWKRGTCRILRMKADTDCADKGSREHRDCNRRIFCNVDFRQFAD
jgi:hypothetical protein